MTVTSQPDDTTPEGTAQTVRDLAKSNLHSFAGAIARDEHLFNTIVQHYRANHLWLDGLIEDLKAIGIPKTTTCRAFRTAVVERAQEQASAHRTTHGLRTIGADEAPPLLRDVLGDDAPVPEDALVPAGYQIARHGIQIEDADGLSPVASRAIVISGALVDQASRLHRFVLSWWDGQQWRKRVVDRGVALNRSKITQEASYGLRVDSENAGAIVRYLAAYESTNDIVTPCLTTTSHLGWQERDAEGTATFLCGTTVLRPGGNAEATTATPDSLEPDTWQPDALIFHARSDGDTQIADAFTPAGSYDQWRQLIRPVAEYPVPLLALYASLAAPVLSIVGASPFIVDICGTTSQGKTTTLQIAASVWGNPDVNAGSTLVGSWNNTGNYVGEVARMMNGLPILLDDTSLGNPKQIPQLIYQLAAGRGRGRMLRDGGTQEVGSWETITLSTGETPLVSYSQDGGTRGRVLTFWGPPFGAAANGSIVTQLRTDLKSAYGHAGPRFVQYLLDHQEDWPRWHQAYQDTVKQCIRDIEDQGGSGIANRLAEHAAVIRLTAVLAHELDLLPWDYRDPLVDLWPILLHGASDADRAMEALQLLHAWAVEHRTQFDGQFPTDSMRNERIPQSVLGAWKGDDRIVFSQGPLRTFLSENNFPVDGILRTWGDRGWLDRGLDNGGATLTKSARIQGVVTRCFVIPMSAFVAVGAADADEVDWQAGRLDSS